MLQTNQVQGFRGMYWPLGICALNWGQRFAGGYPCTGGRYCGGLALGRLWALCQGRCTGSPSTISSCSGCFCSSGISMISFHMFSIGLKSSRFSALMLSLEQQSVVLNRSSYMSLIEFMALSNSLSCPPFRKSVGLLGAFLMLQSPIEICIIELLTNLVEASLFREFCELRFSINSEKLILRSMVIIKLQNLGLVSLRKWEK